MKKAILYITVVAVAILCGCNKYDKQHTKISAVGTVTIEGLNDNEWIYFSFETESVVGTSTLGDDGQDAEWAARLDWDIAFCGENIRTNGGESGKGSGGIIEVTDRSFNALDKAPVSGYVEDEQDVIVR